MTLIDRTADTGTAYGRAPATYIRQLTEVGRGTPMGELLRRYWHPVGLTSDATTTPKAIRRGRGPDRRQLPRGESVRDIRGRELYRRA